jgi:hypothetical protein
LRTAVASRAQSPVSRLRSLRRASPAPIACALAASGVLLTLGVRAATDVPDAPTPAKPAEATPLLDTVNVESQRQRADLGRKVDAYVTTVVGNAFHEGLARWRVRACPLVAGLPSAQGEFVLARLSEIARTGHVPLAAERCRPNLYIVVASEPTALLKKWRARDRRMFDWGVGEGAIGHFLNSTRPVRVWYSTAVSSEDGIPSALGALSIAGANPGLTEIPSNRVPLGTRLKRSVVRVIGSVIVLVDAARVTGLSVGQLADYVSMVAFVDVRENADIGTAPSILALFDERAAGAPQGLSAWDQALVKSLYATNQASVTQVSEIQRRVRQSIAP